ncbi:MAG: HD domain-containing protein [Alphaproteobacteria bacterium]
MAPRDKKPTRGKKAALDKPPKAKSAKAAMYEKLGELGKRVQAYQHPDAPPFKIEEFRKALDLALKHFKSPKSPSINDMFSNDPLRIVEHLVDLQADTETLLAAILYPAVRPRSTGIDAVGMQLVEEFGPNITNLVQRTLQLRSLQLLPLSAYAEQTHEEQLRLYRVMCLRMAVDPRAILIRGTQSLLNLKEFAKTGETLVRHAKENMVTEAENIMANIASVAGYGKLRSDLLDASYRLRNPEEFASTARALDYSGTQKITQADLDTVKRIVGDLVCAKLGISANQFDVEVRQKSPASARAKAMRKGQILEHLGDRYGFRVVLKASIEGVQSKDIGLLDEADREDLLSKMGARCHELYSEMSKKLGRGCRDFKTQFQHLAEIDSHPEFEGKDARFDDYIKNPKPSGYSAIQDTFFIKVGDKLIEFEGQVVDELRHDVNTYGPRAGHVYYKADMTEEAELFGDLWRKAAAEVMAGKNVEPGFTVIFGDDNQVIATEGALTAEDYMRLTIKDEVSRAQIIAARIDNDDPFAKRDPNTAYGLPERLKTADRVRFQLRAA